MVVSSSSQETGGRRQAAGKDHPTISEKTMVTDGLHLGEATVPQTEIQGKLAERYKAMLDNNASLVAARQLTLVWCVNP